MPVAFHRTSLLASLAAATALVAGPAGAAELPRLDVVGAPMLAPMLATPFDTSRFDPSAEQAEWGCWGCGWGWGGGWGGGWRRRGPSAGEVLAGVAIIGGVAAIAATAANNNRRNRTRDVIIVERDRLPDDRRNFDERDLDRRNYERREAARPPRMGGAGMPRSGTSGLEAAVRQCVDRVGRDVRVDSVDSVERTPQGWLVGGVLFNGSDFACRIGNDGRIDSVDYGAGFGAGPGSSSSGQWDDTRYAAARRSAAPSRPDPAGGIEMMQSAASAQPLAGDEETPLVPLSTERLPAYPGGPVEGEEPAPLVERPGIP